MPNAYDVARSYAQNLKFYMGGTSVVRLQPHEEGIQVVCEPGPDPVEVSGCYGRGQEVCYEPETDVTVVRPMTWGDAPKGWVVVPLAWAKDVECEAWDGVTVLFRPSDDGEFFPEL